MIKIDGKSPRKIFYDGKNVAKVMCDGVTVWISKILALVSGKFPLTLEKSTGESLVDYKIYGESVQDGEPTPETPIEVESVGEKTICPAGYEILDYFQSDGYGGLYLPLQRTYLDYAQGETIEITLEQEGISPIGENYNTYFGNSVAEFYTSSVSRLLSYPQTMTSIVYQEPDRTSILEDYKKTTIKLQVVEDFTYNELRPSIFLYGSNTGRYTFKGKFYEFIIRREDGTIRSRILPVKRTSDNIVMGYDVVNDRSIDSLGTLIAGNVIEKYGYKVPVRVSGTNICSYVLPDISISSIGTITANSSFSGWCFEAKKGVTYCLPKRVTSISSFVYAIYDQKPYLKIESIDGQRYNITANRTLVAPADGWIVLRVSVDNENPQINEGEQSLPYEPYFEPYTENIYLNEPLRKIGDYADYIDFKNKKVVRNVGILGTEELANLFFASGFASSAYIGSQYVSLFDTSNKEQFRFKKYFFGGYNSSVENKFRVLCNKLNALNSTFNKNYKYGMIGIDGSLNLYIGKTQPANTTEMAQRIRDLNIELILPLATPTEESIELPDIPLQQGNNVIEVDTKIQPSKGELEYYKK